MKLKIKSRSRSLNRYKTTLAIEAATVLGIVQDSDYKVVITVKPVVNEIANDMRSVGKDICKAYEKMCTHSVGKDYRKVITKDDNTGKLISHSIQKKCTAEDDFERYASLYRATKVY